MNKFFIIATFIFVGCGYSRYNVAGHKYSTEEDVRGKAAKVVVDNGFEIDLMNSNRLETKWEMLYDKNKEYTSRIVINFKDSSVIGQCLQRDRNPKRYLGQTEASWWATPCTGPAKNVSIFYVDQIVESMTSLK